MYTQNDSKIHLQTLEADFSPQNKTQNPYKQMFVNGNQFAGLPEPNTSVYRTLLSRLNGCSLWLKSFLFNVFLPSMFSIFRSSFSGSLPGLTVCYIVVHHPTPIAVRIAG